MGKRRFDRPEAVSRNSAEALVAGRDFAFSRDLDRRTSGYRVYRGLQSAIVEDLGGLDHLSTIQQRLVQHCAALSAFVESEEARLLAGQELRFPELYLGAINALRRLSLTIGLRREPRRPKTLEEYLAAKNKSEE